jgi:hypothetical protein
VVTERFYEIPDAKQMPPGELLKMAMDEPRKGRGAG